MVTLTITDLEDFVLKHLRKRADEHGRSIEAEADHILTEKAGPEKYRTGADFLTATRGCLSESGGIREREFVQPERPQPRDLPEFGG